MPIYEYRRPDGSTFELQQSFSDEPLTHDPETGLEVQRVLHAPAVHFKGSGFYNTDYGTRKRQREEGDKGQSKGDGAAKDGAGAKDSSSAGDTTSDGKTSSKDSSTSESKSSKKVEPATNK
jgi:putative FmdB family regulatory protein